MRFDIEKLASFFLAKDLGKLGSCETRLSSVRTMKTYKPVPGYAKQGGKGRLLKISYE